MTHRRWIPLTGLLALFLAGGPLTAVPQEEPAEQVATYDDVQMLRISHSEGETFVERSYEEGREEGTRNLPVFERDRVGTTDGRLELYAGQRNTIRLDVDTVIEATRPPRLRQTGFALRILNGAVLIGLSNVDPQNPVEIQTPDGGVFPLFQGVYRIAVFPDRSELLVLRGRAELALSENQTTLHQRQYATFSQGRMEHAPTYSYRHQEDPFLSWGSSRDRSLGVDGPQSARYLQAGYEDEEAQLNREGRWRYMAEYGSHVWYPYQVSVGWRPYSTGHWIWHPRYRHIWVAQSNWGWFTHHYGRWHWDPVDGWFWIPRYHWAPAWVSWYTDNTYIGWNPLSIWNRPVVVINNRWHRNHHYRRGIPLHSRSTVFLRRDHFYRGPVHRHAVSLHQIRSSGSLRYAGSRPNLGRPGISRVHVVNALGERVTYKSHGLVSNQWTRRNQTLHSPRTIRRVYSRADGAQNLVRSQRPAFRRHSGERETRITQSRERRGEVRRSTSRRSEQSSSSSRSVIRKKKERSGRTPALASRGQAGLPGASRAGTVSTLTARHRDGYRSPTASITRRATPTNTTRTGVTPRSRAPYRLHRPAQVGTAHPSPQRRPSPALSSRAESYRRSAAPVSRRTANAPGRTTFAPNSSSRSPRSASRLSVPRSGQSVSSSRSTNRAGSRPAGLARGASGRSTVHRVERRK